MDEKFTLSIELGNDTMRTPQDVGRALFRLAIRFQESPVDVIGDEGAIRDENGNTVGRWDIVVHRR